MKTQRRGLPLGYRFEVLARDNFRCRYCGVGPADGAVLHVDHVVPVALGGGGGKENLVAACQDCNLGKHTKLVDAPGDAAVDPPPVDPRALPLGVNITRKIDLAGLDARVRTRLLMTGHEAASCLGTSLDDVAALVECGLLQEVRFNSRVSRIAPGGLRAVAAALNAKLSRQRGTRYPDQPWRRLPATDDDCRAAVDILDSLLRADTARPCA